MESAYCARCLLPVTFAPGRAFTMCPACDSALRLAPETRDPGTTLADDDIAGYPLAARAADRRAGLEAALEALEGEWRAGRWGRYGELIGRRRDARKGRSGRSGCFVADLGCTIFIVIGSVLAAVSVLADAAQDGHWMSAVVKTLTALTWTMLGAFFARFTVGAQLEAIASFRSQRFAYLARRTALRTALGEVPAPPGAGDDDHPRLV